MSKIEIQQSLENYKESHRPEEHTYSSHVGYTRALEYYCDGLEKSVTEIKAKNISHASHLEIIEESYNKLEEKFRKSEKLKDKLAATTPDNYPTPVAAWGMPDALGNIVDTITSEDKSGEMKKWESQYIIPLYTAAPAIKINVKLVTEDGLGSQYVEPAAIELEDDGSTTVVVQAWRETISPEQQETESIQVCRLMKKEVEFNVADFRTDFISTNSINNFEPLKLGVRVTHIPTGLSVTVDSEHSQHKNRYVAFERIKKMIKENPIKPSKVSYSMKINSILEYQFTNGFNSYFMNCAK